MIETFLFLFDDSLSASKPSESAESQEIASYVGTCDARLSCDLRLTDGRLES